MNGLLSFAYQRCIATNQQGEPRLGILFFGVGGFCFVVGGCFLGFSREFCRWVKLKERGPKTSKQINPIFIKRKQRSREDVVI